MKKMLTLALAIAALATVNIAIAKADEAATANSKQQRQDLQAQRKKIMIGFQETKEQWKAQREAALEKIKLQKEEFKANKEKFTAERCAKINERVQERTTNFDNAGAKHTQVYTNLISRIDKFIARFDAAKLDTATIKTHEAELKTKIDKFKEDYAAYIAKLKETKAVTCGHSEGEFKGTLLEAKTLLKTVHADAAGIRTFVRETILVDLKALKAQMPKEEKDATTDGAAETTETEND